MCEFEKPTIEDEVEIDVDASASLYEPTDATLIGVVDGCKCLNIRTEPKKDANNVVCVVESETIVIIDMNESTDEWYKVFTEAGAEGFCMKKFIRITE